MVCGRITGIVMKSNDIKNKINKKYSKYLNLFKGEFNLRLTLLLQDISYEVDALWDYFSIRYDTVMTLDEWKNFSEHRERKPYVSKALKKCGKDKQRFIIELLKDCYSYYSILPQNSFKNDLKNNIAMLLGSFLHWQFDPIVMKLSDVYIGRKPEDRDIGKIDPTEVSINSLKYAIHEYSFNNDLDAEKLEKKIFDLCKGRASILSEYYNICNIDNNLRQEIKGIFNILARNQTFEFFDVHLGWRIWKIVREIGLDVEKYLNLIDFPSYRIVEKKLLEFCLNKNYIKEAEGHLRDEFPRCWKKYKKYGFVTTFDITKEEAERKKYPSQIREEKELKKMVSDCEAEVFELFPLVKTPIPTNVLLNPTHPASTGRAFQSSIRNSLNKRVNTVVMTPRSNERDDYLTTLAHEVSHALHRIVLEKGEECRFLPHGSTDRVPYAILEEFSQLLEKQFAKRVKLPYVKKYTGKEFPNFRTFEASRFQVFYTLVQLGIRKKFDKRYNQGKRNGLAEEEIWSLKFMFDKKIEKWMRLGINIPRENLSSLALFSPTDPNDGLIYMKKYISTVSKTKAEVGGKDGGSTNLQAEFVSRFGENWIEDKTARAFFLCLMLESGRTHNLGDYCNFIKTKDPKEVFIQLEKIEISPKML